MHPGSIPGEASISCANRHLVHWPMMDFVRARSNMVDCQIMPNGVTDHGVLAAFLTIPREAFVPASSKALAYIDEDIEVAPGRYLMEPMTMAKLVQLADLSPTDIVLDVGCSTGYSTAVIAKLCSSVVAVEEDEALAEHASEKLVAEDVMNAAVVTGKLTEGYPQEGPYDAIFINGAIDEVPAAFQDQLKEGGRLVCVIGLGNAATAQLLVREGERLSHRKAFNCAVEPLPGFQKEAGFVF